MFEIRNLDIENVVQFLRYSQIGNDLLRILAERLVDLEGNRGVRVGHFEVVFCELKLARWS